jgi:hypothetical protein
MPILKCIINWRVKRLTTPAIELYLAGKSKIDWFKAFSNATEHGSGMDQFHYRECIRDLWNHFYNGFGNYIDEVEETVIS